MEALHGADERGVSARQIDRLPVVVVTGPATAELVDLVSVEVEDGIDVVVPLTDVLLPLAVAGIEQVDRALERSAQRMDILLRVVVVLEDVPAFVDAVLCRIVQRPEAEVVEDGLHAARVYLLDVGLQGREIGGSAGDVEVGGQRVFARAAQGPMMFVVPVLELHAVDVVAVQVVDHTFDAALGHFAE